MTISKSERTFRTGYLGAFLITIIAVWVLAGNCARAYESPFPQYGKGPVEVRIYTDFFCPPCQAMEPQVEPILRDLLKRGAITLIWVDTPFYRHSALFAKYFLYALKSKNDVDHAFRVRYLLNNATTDRQMTTGSRIEELYKSKGIPYEIFEVRPILERYNALITEDKLQATPTCMIIQDGKKKQFVGGLDIINALKGLK